MGQSIDATAASSMLEKRVAHDGYGSVFVAALLDGHPAKTGIEALGIWRVEVDPRKSQLRRTEYNMLAQR
jgi:hypothetical protein